MIYIFSKIKGVDMKIGIGIDTGGTYTDAVLYDFENHKILYSAKSLTTKEDLSTGIGNALDGIPSTLLREAEFISLSTTLATNACVEEKGGRAKLVFIGLEEKIITQFGASYGFQSSQDIFYLSSDIAGSGEVFKHPDWNAFRACCKDAFAACDAVGIVALHAIHNNAVQEKQAKKIVEEELHIPVICGHELFSDINAVQRGASILLNAQLVPVIAEFLASIKKALKQRNIKAPTVIVRSDGSLMSEEFTGLRPVETLLCGPAASVTGGMHLTGSTNAVIVDMGGTTTDIALVENGLPVQVKNGVQIGKWKTFVKGLFIDTFGLGGDSAVRHQNGSLLLESTRVTPLCIAASQYPSIVPKLQELVLRNKPHNLFLHEFYILLKDITQSSQYNESEKAFCARLKGRPLILEEAAAAAGRDIYSFRVERLEREGVVARAGLTPTDIMHIKGGFCKYDSKASELGAQYVALCLDISAEELCNQVYLQVKQKLYANIVRVLLQNQYPYWEKNGLSPDMDILIRESYQKNAGQIAFGFKTSNVLVGIGAPIHIFLPDVAKALGTDFIVPEYAGVANALGAVVGNVSAVCTIEIKPEAQPDRTILYTVYGAEENRAFTTQPEAEAHAQQEAEKNALILARKRGAAYNISVQSEVAVNSAKTPEGTIYLGTRVTATAVGRILD
jgi:N-methylhydantoinase A/oxoprolinase/acetone carboxylase beta subunit